MSENVSYLTKDQHKNVRLIIEDLFDQAKSEDLSVKQGWAKTLSEVSEAILAVAEARILYTDLPYEAIHDAAQEIISELYRKAYNSTPQVDPKEKELMQIMSGYADAAFNVAIIDPSETSNLKNLRKKANELFEAQGLRS